MTLKINYAKNLLAQSPMANDQKLLHLKHIRSALNVSVLTGTLYDEEAFQLQFSIVNMFQFSIFKMHFSDFFCIFVKCVAHFIELKK